jgi:hypothetical protein
MNEAETQRDREDESTVENLDAARGSRGIPDDHLPTTRLPPLPRSAPISPGSQGPFSQPLGQAPQQPKSNWWRALIASTLPPPDGSAVAVDSRVVDRAVALFCAATALVLVLFALVIGLREAPAQPSISAGVAAVVVTARALLALALLALGALLLRMAERFFAGERGRH